MQSKWSIEEYELLFNEYSIIGDNVLETIKGRAPLTVKNKAYSLGQLPPKKLSEEEMRFVNEHGKSLKSATSFFMFGHSPKEINSIISSC